MKILIAEDDINHISLYKNAMERRNYRVLVTRDGEECLNIYHEELERSTCGKQYTGFNTQPFDAVKLDNKNAENKRSGSCQGNFGS
jgi:CheY-like chemotaxis protein